MILHLESKPDSCFGCNGYRIKVSDVEEVRIYSDSNPADDGRLAVLKTNIEDHCRSSRLYCSLPSEFDLKISMGEINEAEMEISGFECLDYKSDRVLCYPPSDRYQNNGCSPEGLLKDNPEGGPTEKALKPVEDLLLRFQGIKGMSERPFW